MPHGFEKFFPLPFHLEDDEEGQITTLCPASGTSSIDFGIAEGPTAFDAREVQEYLTACANLMPEAVRLVKHALDQEIRRCDRCPNGPEDCGCCAHNDVVADMKNFLAKLEGGSGE